MTNKYQQDFNNWHTRQQQAYNKQQNMIVAQKWMQANLMGVAYSEKQCMGHAS